MCRLTICKYACNHTVKTTKLSCCNSPRYCVNERGSFLRRLAALDPDRIPDEYFEVHHLTNVLCDECQKELIDRKAEDGEKQVKKTSDTISTILDDFDKRLRKRDGITEEKAQVVENIELVKPVKCRVQDCQKLVTIRNGREGTFCESHTCAASKWCCLSGRATSCKPGAGSPYCEYHGCAANGCKRVVDYEVGIYCRKHGLN